MFVICNRIPVAKGHEEEFEKLFLERDDSKSQHPLRSFPGFIRNDILRPTKEEPYIVLTYWDSLEDFEAWTKQRIVSRSNTKDGDGRRFSQAIQISRFIR